MEVVTQGILGGLCLSYSPQKGSPSLEVVTPVRVMVRCPIRSDIPQKGSPSLEVVTTGFTDNTITKYTVSPSKGFSKLGGCDRLVKRMQSLNMMDPQKGSPSLEVVTVARLSEWVSDYMPSKGFSKLGGCDAPSCLFWSQQAKPSKGFSKLGGCDGGAFLLSRRGSRHPSKGFSKLGGCDN